MDELEIDFNMTFAEIRVAIAKRLAKQVWKVKKMGWIWRLFPFDYTWDKYMKEGEELLRQMKEESDRLKGREE